MSLPVKNISNFGMILTRYQLTCPLSTVIYIYIYNSELTKLLFQDDSKMTQADAAVEAAPKD